MRAAAWVAIIGTMTAAGRLTAQESQVPIDSAGRIEYVTPELASRLGLFAEVEGFREARLFQLPDSSFILEITSTVRGTLRRERRPLSSADAIAFRSDITSRVNTRAPSAVLDQSGRTKLLVGSTLLGLGYYGWATALSFDPDNSQSAVAIYMLTGATTFLTPFLLTKNRAVPDPVARMSLWGMMRGPVHGYLAAELGDATQDKTRFGWTVAFGAAEAIAGGVLAQRLRMSPGHAEITGVGGDIGLGVGLALANQMGLDNRQRAITIPDPIGPPYTYFVEDRTLQSASMLASSGIGLATGYLMGRSGDWSVGDAVVFRNVSVIGSVAGLALGDIIHQPKLITDQIPGSGSTYSYYEDNFSRWHSGGALLGTAGGMLLGRRLVSGRNFTGGQGALLTLAPLAGGLIGLGVAYLATPERQYDYNPSLPYRDPNDHSELYLGMSALGAAAGFAAMYPPMARQATRFGEASNLRFSVNPLALAQLAGRRGGDIMLGTVEYRF